MVKLKGNWSLIITGKDCYFCWCSKSFHKIIGIIWGFFSLLIILCCFCLIRYLPTRTVWCVLGPLFLMATPFATTPRPTTSTSPLLPSTAARRQTRRTSLLRWRTHCVGSKSYCSLPYRTTPLSTLDSAPFKRLILFKAKLERAWWDFIHTIVFLLCDMAGMVKQHHADFFASLKQD